MNFSRPFRRGGTTVKSLAVVRAAAAVAALMFYATAGMAGADIIHVTTSGSNSNSGADWANAKETPAAALRAAEAGDEVWVAAGLYSNSHLLIPVGVVVLGGFDGTETDETSRNPEANLTTLDGGGLGKVVRFEAGGGETQGVDGFILQNAQFGVFMRDTGAFVSNCTVTGNTVTGIVLRSCNGAVVSDNVVENNGSGPDTGGIFTVNCALATVESNAIQYNSTSGSGGGFCSRWSTVILEDNTISNNIADVSGGGIMLFDSFVEVLGNTIAGNDSLTGDGGGLRASSDCILTIRGNNLWVNDSSGTGGGLFIDGGTAVLEDNEIVGNEAVGGAGGFDLADVSDLVFRGNTVQSNIGGESGGGIIHGLTALVEDNVFALNEGSGYGGGVHIYDTVLILQRNQFIENTAVHNGGGAEVNCLTFLIASNLFDGNKAKYNTGLTVAYSSTSPDWLDTNRILNNTFVNNESSLPEGNAALGLYEAVALIANNIFSYNASISMFSNPGTVVDMPRSVAIYNCVNDTIKWDGFVDYYLHLEVDPDFENPGAEDYRLKGSSQCVDAGGPYADAAWDDLDGGDRIENFIVDIGAYEYP